MAKRSPEESHDPVPGTAAGPQDALHYLLLGSSMREAFNHGLTVEKLTLQRD